MTKPRIMDVDYRNPADFMLAVAKSASPCPVCTSVEVAVLFAPAQTPELHQIAIDRFGENAPSDEVVPWLVEQTPLMAVCGVCGHRQYHNWHFIEDPKVDAQGNVLRDGPPNEVADA